MIICPSIRLVCSEYMEPILGLRHSKGYRVQYRSNKLNLKTHLDVKEKEILGDIERLCKMAR